MADAIVSWLVSALMLVTVAAFVAYLLAARRLPAERPDVRTYDRAGRLLGRYPNPGEQIGPGRAGDPLRDRRQHGQDTG